MAASVNKVILVGNMGADPEVRHTQDGKPIANCRIATNESWTDQSGNKQERTEWHRVVVFGGLADVVSKYLKKGDNVYFEGKIQTRKWTDQSGQDRYSTEVVVDQRGVMQMLGSRNSSGQSRDSYSYNQEAKPANSPSAAEKPANITQEQPFDDEIPF